MGFYRLLRKIHHFIVATHWKGHGIHSPSVYSLVRSFYGNKKGCSVVFNIIADRQRDLLSNRTLIERVDQCELCFDMVSGKGRRIDSIARNVSVNEKYGRLLSLLAGGFKGNHIVEIGSSLGLSTAYLSAGDKNKRVILIGECRELAEIARETLIAAGSGKCEIKYGRIKQILPEVISESGGEALFYIGSGLMHGSVLECFNIISGMANNSSLIIIGDIDRSSDMRRAWNVIKANERVVVSIELSRFGIIIPDKEITPGHYIVRY